ncbi:cell division ATP-binding protein FtsE [Paraperlucidibaca wandonensis]|jgi:cell division transport system ATP-binding protein|uniref:Cell division ATP-binding protein FtsE n=1 Tax=Paraperlucidibaca wandonensis TaxID=1268273 RepID=A0ABW3HII8_9GAMM|nr:cell division ATP-binding protein FtsE [Paraperlucidibaca sp.]MBQ0723527.1 cell division ATP-binding protein FtsE [Paraperlucidibaca sp.]MBQ0843050.1 cell division ATP-binding protein FtsE [Paraperlucidibaca sp.]|tara:strand:+ start:2107 stop:2778 length:672 start_codon:yes stop_codon:yes gene_type:complete
MISFKSVSKRYPPQFDALRELSFDLPTGEMAFLTGHSGAGKSTLLKLIMRIEKASSGQVIVNGRDQGLLKGKQVAFARRDIGMVYQDHNLLDDRSVFDNVALPLIISGMPPRDIPNRVYAALDLVGLKHRAKAMPLELSGGEQQRVGIARAVVGKPSVILADEPTGNLDPQLAVEVMNIFEDLSRVGVSILVATHDLALIARFRHRLLTLQAGQLVADTGAAT